MDHSILGPSSAGIWAPKHGCTAYVKAVLDFPEDEEMYSPSADGTAAHEVAETRLAGRDLPVGSVASNGTVITFDMYDAANTYVEDVQRIAAGSLDLKIEQRLHARGIHPELWGTCDASLLTIQRLTIWDFKNGRGAVEAFENWQIITYCYGILSGMAKHGYTAPVDLEIDMRIVQPNAYHEDGPVRSWVVKLSELKPYFEQLQRAAAIAMSDRAIARTGKHCRYCQVRHACKALQADATSAADFATQATPHVLSDEALGAELSILKDAQRAINYRVEGLTAQVEQTITDGRNVPGWSISRAKGREKWTDADAAAIMAGLCGLDIHKPADLVTPKQARDKGMDAGIVAQYSARNAGKVTLQQTDKNKIRKIFS